MKAVVVIDMPERCNGCPVRHAGMAYCTIGKFSTSHFNTGKPVNQMKKHPKCPLKVLPLKMSAPTYRNYEAYIAAANYISGWNDCIDRITGDDDDGVERCKQMPEMRAKNEGIRLAQCKESSDTVQGMPELLDPVQDD